MHPRRSLRAAAGRDDLAHPARGPGRTRDPVISSARSALGGRQRFPTPKATAPKSDYILTEQVSTDWEHFCAPTDGPAKR